MKQAITKILAASLLLYLSAESAQAGHAYTYFNWFGRYEQSFNKGGGCVSGSITTDISERQTVTFYFTSDPDRKNHAELALDAFSKKYTINTGDVRGDVFMFCLKPGKYEIFKIGLHNGTLNQGATKPFSVSFQVDSGKHYYIGNILWHDLASMHRSNYTESNCRNQNSKYFFEVIDSSDRDLDLIAKKKKYPGITPTVALLDTAAGAPYFVACQTTS